MMAASAEVLAEREQCCKDVCMWCAAGLPVRKSSGDHAEWVGEWVHERMEEVFAGFDERHDRVLTYERRPVLRICEAWAIRKRAEKEG